MIEAADAWARAMEAMAEAEERRDTGYSMEEFERTELTLHDGDALILYTDGVSEAFNPLEECYGNERLLADAGVFAGLTAAQLADETLMAALNDKYDIVNLGGVPSHE